MSAARAPAARGLLAALLALLCLTALTVAAAFRDLGPWNDLIALAIAGAKAAIVVVVFMHARRAERLIWIFAGVGLLWLLLLIGGTVADFDSRHALPPWSE